MAVSNDSDSEDFPAICDAIEPVSDSGIREPLSPFRSGEEGRVKVEGDAQHDDGDEQDHDRLNQG
jgi:hypothetical protein